LCSAQKGLDELSQLQHNGLKRECAPAYACTASAASPNGWFSTGESFMTDTAESFKKTADKVADQTAAQAAFTGAKVEAQSQAFQAAGAKAFRDGVEKSVASFSELNAQGKKNLDALVESATVAQKGAEALSQQALGFAKTSWEDGVAAGKELSGARSVQEFFELQTAWAKKSMERYMAELARTNEIVATTVKDSVKPINERVTASVETFQAAR
jgi:phasin family protein